MNGKPGATAGAVSRRAKWPVSRTNREVGKPCALSSAPAGALDSSPGRSAASPGFRAADNQSRPAGVTRRRAVLGDGAMWRVCPAAAHTDLRQFLIGAGVSGAPRANRGELPAQVVMRHVNITWAAGRSSPTSQRRKPRRRRVGPPGPGAADLAGRRDASRLGRRRVGVLRGCRLGLGRRRSVLQGLTKFLENLDVAFSFFA